MLYTNGETYNVGMVPCRCINNANVMESFLTHIMNTSASQSTKFNDDVKTRG